MPEKFRDAALSYHRDPVPGKLRIQATKPLASQRDLAMAYLPGVAAACEEIVRDANQAAALTARGNLVAVITNGTAVLGLGAIGPLAAKPVMEGKAMLFKKFADIDAFDIEINEHDPDKLVDIIAGLEPTFGGINLEDISAPQCFVVEQRLRERLSIPVFHDDQHGTAIVTAAAVTNGLRLVRKSPAGVKLVVSGAGAAAIACTDLLVALGLQRKNILMLDSTGVIRSDRAQPVSEQKSRYAAQTSARTLDEAIVNADIFLGLSVAGLLTPQMVKSMAKAPLILALANPDPEIMPEEARAVRPDVIIATGRSDYPNQVNNVLCFPFLFRGALDVGATSINDPMKLAAVKAIADLAMAESSDVVATKYIGQNLTFGPDYILPKPFDPRLIVAVAPAVAEAAMASGVATRPLEDLDGYRHSLQRVVFQSGTVMKPVFESAQQSPRRLIYADGEDQRVLRAVQIMLDEGYAQPVVIGRGEVVHRHTRELGLRCRPGVDFDLIDPIIYPNYTELAAEYHALLGRRGVQPEAALALVRTQSTVLGSLLLQRGMGDAMIAGPVGTFLGHLEHIRDVIGLRDGVSTPAGMQVLILDRGTFFLADTSVNDDPDAEVIADVTLLAAEQVQRFGIRPKVALLSHSNFGSRDTPGARKLRQALRILEQRMPNLEVDGEMKSDSALSEAIRRQALPSSQLDGQANLLIMPNLDAADICYNALKVLKSAVSVGPIVLGLNKPAHILSRTVSTRGIVNLSTFAVVDAQARATQLHM